MRHGRVPHLCDGHVWCWLAHSQGLGLREAMRPRRRRLGQGGSGGSVKLCACWGSSYAWSWVGSSYAWSWVVVGRSNAAPCVLWWGGQMQHHVCEAVCERLCVRGFVCFHAGAFFVLETLKMSHRRGCIYEVYPQDDAIPNACSCVVLLLQPRDDSGLWTGKRCTAAAK